MYQVGGKTSTATNLAASVTGGSTLAFTGFPVVGVAIVAIVAIVCGLILLRVAMVRRHRGDEVPA